MTTKRVLYLGDTSLQTAAAYLAGVMHYYDIDFCYRDSSTQFSDDLLEQGYALIIISDYAAHNFTAAQLETVVEKVQSGAMALWMIGGWETYVGLGGDYHKTILADLLPLRMEESDDRVNS